MEESGDNSKLLGGAKLVQYEINMLIYSFICIGNAKQNRNENLKKMAIESFVAHTRNLIDFLFDKGQKDCIYSTSYVEDNKDWKGARGNLEGFLNDVRSDAHKYLAHITYTRINKLDWEFSKILKELSRQFLLFIRHLAEERKNWFDISGLAALANREGEIVDGTWSIEGTWRGN